MFVEEPHDTFSGKDTIHFITLGRLLSALTTLERFSAPPALSLSTALDYRGAINAKTRKSPSNRVR